MAKDRLANELTALSRACDLNPEGSTIRELCAATGWGDDKVRRWLRVLQSQGGLVAARRTITNIAGGTTHIPVYKAKPRK